MKEIEKNKKDTAKLTSKKGWMQKLEDLTGPIEELKDDNNFIKGCVFILLDCSGSMISGNKINQARNGVIKFSKLASKKNYKTGLISFSSGAQVKVDPEKKLDKLISNVKRIEAGGGTNLTAALNLVLKKFDTNKGRKVVYIVTDGQPNDRESSLEAANKLKEQQIIIMTLGTDDADKDFLAKLSSEKGLNKMISIDNFESGIGSMVSKLPVIKD